MTWLHFLSPWLAPAETTDYMIAGYVVIFTVMFLYMGSLALRRRSLERDIALLEELDEENTR